MWSINSRSGMEGRRHEHEGAISAAYYVDAGTSSECAGGQLQFYAEATKPSPTHAVTPRDGLLILFPSRLHHSVSRYSSDYPRIVIRSEEQTSELQSLMRISYAVFCLKNKNTNH